MRTKWLMLLFLAAAPLIAEECCCISSCECCESPYSGRLSFRHTEPGGIGYRRGYTSMDLFYSANINEKWYGIMDARGHIFNDGKWATNFGLGLRYFPECYEMVSGFNVYWDWREAEHTTFHQLGAGIEALWPCWDIRFNGYAPVSRQKKAYRKGFERFQENEAIVFKKWELGMSGFDGVVGYWICKNECFGLHASLGGYYFTGDFNKQAGGGLARAKVKFWDYVTLDGQVSYDSLFKWEANGGLALHFPLKPHVTRYPRKICCCADVIALEDRIAEQPERFEMIITTTRKSTARALHPNTGNPLTFFFVNNTSSSLGTFESPFPTLAEAQAEAGVGQAIYVFQGDGTDTGMNTGTTLEDLQVFAGSGGPLRVRSRFGPITIPPQTPLRPKVSNAGDVITLANGNIISGLDLSGENIFVGDNTVGLYVLDNVMTFAEPASTVGIDITGSAGGQFQINNNIMRGSSSGGGSTALFLQGVFNGHVVWGNNSITLSSAGISSVMTISDEFTGSMTAGSNAISSSGASGLGFNIDAPVNADWMLDSNTITTNGSGDGSQKSCAHFFSGSGNFQGNFVTKNNTLIHIATNGATVSPLTSLGIFQGNFTAHRNRVLAVSATGTAGGFIFGDINAPSSFILTENIIDASTTGACLGFGTQGDFLSDLLAQGNVFNVEGSLGIGFFFGDPVTGNLSFQNNRVTTNGTTSAGILFLDPVEGNFTAQGNRIHTRTTGFDLGVGFFSSFTGNAIAEYNEITTEIGSDFSMGLYLNGEAFFRNNSFVQQLSSTNRSFDIIAGDDVEAIIQNNFISHAAGTGESFRFENVAGISHLRFFKNDLSSPGATTDGNFVNTAGTLELESPNLQLSGVEALNEGRLSESGVTFVPFE